MRYAKARFEENQRKEAYRIFVTKSLQLIPQSKCLTLDYVEVIGEKEIDKRSGDEIAADVMEKAGLSF